MPETLLIVDDEPNILRTLTRLFRNSGYQILTATSGQDALKLLAENSVQVIISDQRMPFMSGSDLLREVKKIYPDTVRIILSGYADFDAIKDAINEGSIYKFITKPWDDALLRQHVQEAFHTHALHNKNKWGSQILENSLEGVVITNGQGEIIKVNQAYTTISGCDEAEIIGKKFIFLSPHHPNPDPKEINDQLEKTGNWRGEIWAQGKGDKVYPAWLAISTLFNTHHRATQFTYILLDISKQKEQEKIFNNQIYLDKVTGLNNRFYYSTQLALAIEQAKKNQSELVVVCLDLDRFGVINHNLGYEAGNLVLRHIADYLKMAVDGDNIVARMGNDEFAILLQNNHSVAELDTILDKIKNLSNRPLLIANTTIYVSMSIGVSRFPLHGDHPDVLINNAVLALGVSKELVGNIYQVYNDTMVKSAKVQLNLETELHQALEKKQFVIYYQPIVNAEHGKIVGVEALLRWQHPTKGLLSPNNFLDLCETTGLIIPIGNWILQEACLQIKKIHAMGFPEMGVAVNLSVRQFNDPKLYDSIKAILETSAIPPQCLKIEITESLSMQNIEMNIKLLHRFKKLGLQLVLDDFGTGYSSMSYLQRLPFNVLKIDKSFIQNISTDNNNSAIVRAIIALAKSLGLTLIAEGVETAEQLQLLQKMRCDLVQGYLFSKPLPEHELIELLLKRNE